MVRGQFMTENKTMICANKKEKIDNFLFYEDININIPTATKILGITTTCKFYNYESLSGEVKVSGKFISRILYLNEEYNMLSEEYISDFMETIEIPLLTPSNRVFLFSNVVDCEYSGTTDLDIKLTLQINGYYIKECSLSLLDCQEQDIYCKKSNLQIESVSELADTTLETSQSFETKMPLSKILSYNSICWINHIYPSQEMYQVQGEALTSIIALNEEGEVFCENFSSTFNTEIPDSVVNESSNLIVDSNIKSTTITLAVVGSRDIIIDLEIGIQGTCITTNEIEYICDAYSIKNEIITNSIKSNIYNNINYSIKKEMISTSISVEENNIKNIEFMFPPIIGEANAINDFGVFVEGIINCELIYKNQEEQIEKTKTEIPYRINIDSDIKENLCLMPKVMTTNYYAKMKNNSEIEIYVEVMISVKGVQFKEIKIVDEIEYGEEKEENDIAISLYLSKEGETMWDVAKALSTDENTLMRLNPDISLPLGNGEKILLYREL